MKRKTAQRIDETRTRRERKVEIANARIVLIGLLEDLVNSNDERTLELVLESPLILHAWLLSKLPDKELNEELTREEFLSLTGEIIKTHFLTWRTYWWPGQYKVSREPLQFPRRPKHVQFHYMKLLYSEKEAKAKFGGKFFAHRSHYKYDDNGEPYPVNTKMENARVPLFLDDYPEIKEVDVSKGRHIFYDMDDKRFLGYVECGLMSNQYVQMVNSIQTFECDVRAGVRNHSMTKAHVVTAKMVASGVKAYGPRGNCYPGMSMYKTSANASVSELVRQLVVYPLLEVAKGIIVDVENGYTMFQYFKGAGNAIINSMEESGKLEAAGLQSKDISFGNLMQVFTTHNYCNAMHIDPDHKYDSHSYGIGFQTGGGAPVDARGCEERFFFVCPQHGFYFRMQSNMYWGWNTSLYHGTSVFPEGLQSSQRYTSGIGVQAKLGREASKSSSFVEDAESESSSVGWKFKKC
ncbi:hypothetical protein BCR33DRAFT_775188 [Rhizoclosmatium globosum]|uniref:Uncharacterized protein n=1 Tax=Rhizoclosmatium globosum TaxID=329046 RepID=A0A1Y2AMD0_9FUNG|nr:hypothetical protein BCR33DRAFT_775188 [Rhizoclosmatium globosum]|eukprot:ORY23642.1 hypothetical protein BCR33DRAFT_775188 [Rhizoclosmatium globosum]